MSYSYLDSTFVEQNVALSRDEGKLTAIRFNDRALLRLCSVSPLARQRFLVELMDRIMTTSGQQSEFALPRKELVDQYFELSPLLSAMTKILPESCELVQRVMESIAEVAGEIVDWRFVRICVLLVEWMSTRLQQTECETMQVDLIEDESKSGSEMDVLFETMMASARLLLDQGRTSASTETQLQEMSQFLSAQRSYVFSSARPEQLILRKRLAFLVNNAVAQCNGLLAHLIRHYLEALEKSQERHRPSVVLFMAELILPCESEPIISAVVDQLLALLKDLQELCSTYSRDSGLVVVALEEQLVQVFNRYRSVLVLNTALLADVICAMGIYMDTKDSTVWSAMVRPALSLTKDSRQGHSPIFPWALVIRLQDITHIIDNPGLDVAQEELASYGRSVIID
ncbi:hypothetical protein BGZ58_007862 [Dissophora ornata]|nr:hypothetical protein BGZ58_007862 [Dissophora ornata]